MLIDKVHLILWVIVKMTTAIIKEIFMSCLYFLRWKKENRLHPCDFIMQQGTVPSVSFQYFMSEMLSHVVNKVIKINY